MRVVICDGRFEVFREGEITEEEEILLFQMFWKWIHGSPECPR